jgi:hypothetical protein
MGRPTRDEAGGTRSAGEVFEAHLEAAARGDVETDIEENFGTDVVLLTGVGIFRGHAGVRLSRAILAADAPEARFRYLTRLVDGEFAFLEWRADADAIEIDDGADSFLVQDGLIRVQTIHYTVRHRAGYHERIGHLLEGASGGAELPVPGSG